MRRICLAVLLLAAAFRALATDYTDIWFNPSEQSTAGGGWGVNAVQSDAFLFLTFFIYGPDNKPTWYVAGLTQDANGNFNGQLYATTGTYFGAPWNPADGAGSAQVGTASFAPTSAYTANLTYSFTGGVTVVKAIQRQALTSIPLGGSYSGTQAGSYSNCNNGFAYTDRFRLGVAQPTASTLTFSFAYSDSGLSCTLSGTVEQHGQLFRIPSASYTCSDGLSTTAAVDEIKATNFGIEARITAPNNAGCREDATFSAVFLPPI
ncbi:MAG TPA: hypothetical protein VH704_02390 [Casimicrobiaceae bacterium]|nr:hypothetical protein [Casimicrobiaceae bacterium]